MAFPCPRRPDDTRFREGIHPFAVAEHIMEAKKGEQPKKLKIYNIKERILIDEELTKRSIDFMERKVKEKKSYNHQYQGFSRKMLLFPAQHTGSASCRG